jgi:hypothetical protein
MNGQLLFYFVAIDYTIGLHFVTAPISAAVQIGLSSRKDIEEGIVPISSATAVLYGFKQQNGSFELFDDAFLSSFFEGDLVEVWGYLSADRCLAAAVVNFFIWSSGLKKEETLVKKRRLAASINGPELEDIKVVVLYDESSGKIAHMHAVFGFEGGRTVSEQEAIDVARRQAMRFGREVSRLKVKVSNNRALVQHPHRFDPETGEFVRHPRGNFASPIPG